MNNPKEDETEKLHFIKYISNDIGKKYTLWSDGNLWMRIIDEKSSGI